MHFTGCLTLGHTSSGYSCLQLPGSSPGVKHGAVLRVQGRPKGPEEKSSLKHVVASLSKAIGLQVREAKTTLIFCSAGDWHQIAVIAQ